jgi:N-acetyl-anhydromuramyl-L-alanine amidase AmpD
LLKIWSLEVSMQRKKTEFIVVHCSATKPDFDIGAAEIRGWHLARGWQDIGYHLVIRRNGAVETGRPIDSQGAHVSGHNHNSVGICLIGGLDESGAAENNFTDRQMTMLRIVIDGLRARYPGASVLGHRDFPEVAKDCPCFDVRGWYGQHR